MAIPNPTMLMRVGIVLIAASLVLFTVSAIQISSGGQSFGQHSLPDHSFQYFNFSKNVTAGDDLEYTILPSSSHVNITAFLITPSGSSMDYSNVTIASVSKVIVAPYTGHWELVVHNNANATANFSASMTDISYSSLLMLDFAVALLPSGAALLVLAMIIRRRERAIARRRNY
ncbi:MAG: hypothetical protein M1454_01690 [Candidatus Thermoplasmatota archaeon]|nr:hypothetical protein [Candidatus Thermoplasmatota archaeon]MCL5730898.1 hypothetical protein [Candidatus Thermoplasmatota archaeon]